MRKKQLTERLNKAQQAVRDAGLDVLFIVGRENIIYFTGTTQLECMSLLIPREGDPAAITLWLDVEYLKELCPVPEIKGYHFPAQNLISKTVEVINAYGFENPRIGFEKYFVEFSVYDELRKAFSEDNFVNAGELLYRLRSVKSDDEVNMIRQASEMVCKGMEAAVRAVKPGVMELEVLAEAEYAMMKAGSGGSPFRMQVVSGDRALLTHPCASQKKLIENEIVVIHLGATCEGYCSKICRTIALGNIPLAQQVTHELLKSAQDNALSVLKPGVRSRDVDAAARQIMVQAGYEQNFLDLIGYGVGLRQSEFYPIIGKGRDDIIEENMVIDILLPTIYKLGVGGPRITDVIHVNAEGSALLTSYPRQLIKV